jgi:hypothetical protein
MCWMAEGALFVAGGAMNVGLTNSTNSDAFVTSDGAFAAHNNRPAATITTQSPRHFLAKFIG